VPRLVRRIDVFLPLDYNDGRQVEETKFAKLENELLIRFGGVTSFRRQFPLQGLWQSKGKVFQDRVVIFTALDFSAQDNAELVEYLEGLKKRLKRKFAQKEILITIHELLAI
jgi:hypothetical protein